VISTSEGDCHVLTLPDLLHTPGTQLLRMIHTQTKKGEYRM